MNKMNSEYNETRPTKGLRALFVFLVFVFAATFFPFQAFAQEMPADAEPPPIKVISKEERESLFIEKDLKKRTKLILELIEVRLVNAEDQYSKKQFIDMYKELGRFHALVDNGLAFLQKNDTGKGKVLDSFKRFEIGLRGFLPRLELIRRDLPLNYEFYVRALIKSIRDTRRDAVDPQFGETVLPRNQKPN